MLKKKTGIFIEDVRFGGPQRLLINLSKAIKNKKNLEIIFPFEESKIFKNEIKKNKIKYLQVQLCWLNKNLLGYLNYIIFFLFDIYKLAKIISSKKFNTIYIFGGASNFKTAISSKILNKKIVWHLHETKINFLNKCIFKFLYNNNIKIIFSSNACKDYYKKFYFTKKL